MNEQSSIHMRELILDTFCAACNRERSALAPQTSLEELGLDSLSLMSVLSQVQFACGVQLNDDQTLHLLNATTVADIVVRFIELAGARDACSPA
jgi:acyl carrier protein